MKHILAKILLSNILSNSIVPVKTPLKCSKSNNLRKNLQINAAVDISLNSLLKRERLNFSIQRYRGCDLLRHLKVIYDYEFKLINWHDKITG